MRDPAMVDQQTTKRRMGKQFHSPESKRPLFLRYLDLPSSCTEKDVQLAYRRMAKECHPDHGGNVARFRELRKNYEAALRFVQKQPVQPVQPNNSSLDPFRFATQSSGRHKKTVIAIACVLIIGLIVATLFGKGLLAFASLFFLLAILLGPISASSFRPIFTGIFFAGTCIVVAGYIVGGFQAGLFEFLYADDFLRREPAENELFIFATLLFAVFMIFSAFASWLISLAAHDH